MKAIDLLKQLQQNPEYIARQKDKQKELEKKEKEIKLAEIPFIKEVQESGFKEIKQSSDLLKYKSIPEQLTNILARWIPQINNDNHSQEILIRALAISEVAFDGKFLIDLFDKSSSSFSLKWAIGNTIASAKVLNIDTWIEKKLMSPNQGKENEMLVYAAMKYFPYSKSHLLLRSVFDIYPLQVADAFTYIGKMDDFEFLSAKSKNYQGDVRAEIEKSLKDLEKKIK